MKNTHDILDKIGKPLMIGSGVVFLVTQNQAARWLAVVGAAMELSWVVCDVAYTYTKED